MHHFLRQLGEQVLDKIITFFFPPLFTHRCVLFSKRDNSVKISLTQDKVSISVKGLHLNNHIKLEMTGRTQDELWLPMLVILAHWGFNQKFNKLDKGGFFPHEKRIFWKLFLVLLSKLCNYISTIHSIVITSSILEVSAVVR